AIGFTACKNGEKKEESPSQMQEVMAVHDELMPKMSEISNLMGQLEAKIDSTEATIKYQKAKKDLESAHMAMMDWMKDFGTKFDSDEILKSKELSEEKKKLLNQEQKEVIELEEQIEASIANAKKLLSE